MASNSTDNPAPSVITDIFNPELWNDTDKATTTTSEIPTGYATLNETNTYLSNNYFNGDVYINRTLTIKNSFYLNHTTLLTSNFSALTLSIPLSSTYLFRNTGINGTITLPVASDTYNGCVLTFKRTNTSNRQIFSSLINIYTMTNNFAISNIILTTTSRISQIACLPTAFNNTQYQWVQIAYQ
jgi:hypothetical protein